MIYRFGDYSLDTSSFELRRDREIVPVVPQVFNLLAYLIANRAHLVSKDDLIASVWDGRIVSEATLSSRISAARQAVGDTGEAQEIIKTVRSRGFRFVAEVAETEHRQSGVAGSSHSTQSNQRIKFCESKDGTQIAYATIGAGPPLVRAGHWLTHLEHDWHSPVWRPFLDEFARSFQVTRYDQRGNGLSDWSIRNASLDAFVDDLEAVVDAAKIDRFALYGTSQGAPIAVSYAVRHPDRVSHLVLKAAIYAARKRNANRAKPSWP